MRVVASPKTQVGLCTTDSVSVKHVLMPAAAVVSDMLGPPRPVTLAWTVRS